MPQAKAKTKAKGRERKRESIKGRRKERRRCKVRGRPGRAAHHIPGGTAERWQPPGLTMDVVLAVKVVGMDTFGFEGSKVGFAGLTAKQSGALLLEVCQV